MYVHPLSAVTSRPIDGLREEEKEKEKEGKKLMHRFTYTFTAM